MLIPFYIFRYEKELSQIDSDEERLEKTEKRIREGGRNAGSGM